MKKIYLFWQGFTPAIQHKRYNEILPLPDALLFNFISVWLKQEIASPFIVPHRDRNDSFLQNATCETNTKQRFW
ncbi:MAG: hypothetical protein JW798_12905 [Prolixibacteraceae bacterium]|nr:hypothetical protein [Prolixibacteraceae bacterium]